MERADLESHIIATDCAEQCGGFTFLIDPHWTPAQREAFARITRSVTGSFQSKVAQGWLCIPTGGSSGGLRFARHDEQTLSAAVRGYCAHFEMGRVNTLDVLPPWHVSGLMARVRSAMTNGRHVPWSWKQLEQGEVPKLADTENFVLSLVPTQLQRLMGNSKMITWLGSLKLILLGGGPVWPELKNVARDARLPIALSYGMTETAAMVVAQRPGVFLQGDDSSGCALPHVRIEILDAQTGRARPEGETGIVRVTGDSVMRGYLPEDVVARGFVTADLGHLDSSQRLHILGRRDDVVITGGENVNPHDVEAVLRSTGAFTDVAVIGIPDAEWGEVLIACYTGEMKKDCDQVINSHLLRHQRPKRYQQIAESDWPRNAQGKVNRAVLRKLAMLDPRQ